MVWSIYSCAVSRAFEKETWTWKTVVSNCSKLPLVPELNLFADAVCNITSHLIQKAKFKHDIKCCSTVHPSFSCITICSVCGFDGICVSYEVYMQ